MKQLLSTRYLLGSLMLANTVDGFMQIREDDVSGLKPVNNNKMGDVEKQRKRSSKKFVRVGRRLKEEKSSKKTKKGSDSDDKEENTDAPTKTPTPSATQSPTIITTESSLSPTITTTSSSSSEPPTLTSSDLASLQPSTTPTDTQEPEYEDLLWVACGDPLNTTCSEREGGVEAIVVVTEKYAVRCCSDVELEGWLQVPGCPVWAASEVGLELQCYSKESFAFSDFTCFVSGGRLCTREEITNGCTVGSGCELENHFVWTSSVAEPPFLTGQWRVLGGGTEASIELDLLSDLKVRCCSDVAIPGWLTQPQCTGVWSRAKVPECSNGSFAAAAEICEAAGGRLCTKAEIQLGCTIGTGCNFDGQDIWSSTRAYLEEGGEENSSPPTEISPGEETSSPPTEISTISSPPTTSPLPEDLVYVVCGDVLNSTCSDREGGGEVIVAVTEEHAVRCCSDTVLPGWIQNPGCAVWSLSEVASDSECRSRDTFAEAEFGCFETGGRLCSREEITSGCTVGSGCEHEIDLVWTSSVAEPPFDIGFFKVRGDGTKARVELDLLADLKIRCCSNVSIPGWLTQPQCIGVWSTSAPDCATGDYETAFQKCKEGGGRLCTKQEVQDGCTLKTGCNFDSFFIWSSTTAFLEKEEESSAPTQTTTQTLLPSTPPPESIPIEDDLLYVVCGDVTNTTCTEMEGGIEAIAAVSEEHAVSCCSDGELPGWVQNPGCAVWASSLVGTDPQCLPTEGFALADFNCFLSGGRLCTRDELVTGCTVNSGCGFESDLVWSSSVPLPPFETGVWIVLGKGTESLVELDLLSVQRIRCCADSDVPITGWLRQPQCEVWSRSAPGCATGDYEEASQICEEAGGRLCTKQEVQDGCTLQTGCNFDNFFIWSRSPGYLEASEVGSSQPSSTLAPGASNPPTVLPFDGDLLYVVCGDVTNTTCTEMEGGIEAIAAVSEEHAVSCCSDGELPGWVQNPGCAVWASSLVGTDPQCLPTEGFALADFNCFLSGGRLCTRDELVTGCTVNSGCGFESDLVWSSSVPLPPFETGVWIVLGKGTESLVELDLLSVQRIRCCADSDVPITGWLRQPQCEVWSRSAPGCATGDYEEASQICEEAGGRLCTKQEVQDGCTLQTGCNFDNFFIWSRSPGYLEASEVGSSQPSSTLAPGASNPPTVLPFDGDLLYVVCGDVTNTTCTEMEGGIEAIAAVSEEHAVSCCSDGELPGWVQNPGCAVWASSLVGTDPQCLPTEGFALADFNCFLSGGRLCTRDELVTGCTVNSGCGFESDLVWSSSVPLPPFETGVWIVLGKGTESLVELDLLSVQRIRCCADSDAPITGWLRQPQCEVWSRSAPGCATGDYEEASQICEEAGGRLCTKQEVQDGCTLQTGCNFDNFFIWSRSPGYLEASEVGSSQPSSTLAPGASNPPTVLPFDGDLLYVVCGDVTNTTCTEMEGGIEAIAAVSEEHAVSCCSDGELPGWVQNPGCAVWASSLVGTDPQCLPTEGFALADFNCFLSGGRLCTRDELVTGCTVNSGCGFESDLVWSSSVPLPPFETGVWIVLGKGTESLVELDLLSVQRIRCCADSDAPITGWLRQPQCEVWSRSAPGCATGDYEEASQICEEAGGRLCTKQEVQDGCTLQTGCNFDNFFIWSRSPGYLEASEVGSSQPSSTLAPGASNPPTVLPFDGDLLYVVCGDVTNTTCTEMEGGIEAIAAVSEEHAVSCCSDGELPGWVQNPGCAVWASSLVGTDPQCLPTEGFALADFNCFLSGGRLCTRDELVTGCTVNSGCGFESDLVWSSSVPLPPFETGVWIVLGKGTESLVELDLLSVQRIRCCADSDVPITGWVRQPQCEVWSRSAPGCATGDYEEASQICEEAGGRLCTKQEVQDGCTLQTGCNFDNFFIWSRSPGYLEASEVGSSQPSSTLAPGASNPPTVLPFDGDLLYVVCGDVTNTTCTEMEGGIEAIAAVSEEHAVSCCSDGELPGWVQNPGCAVWASSLVGTDPQCLPTEGFALADFNCFLSGGRLCTRDELVTGCTVNSGCGFESDLVWSSSVPLPPFETGVWIVLGKGTESLVELDLFSVQRIRCCADSDVPITGWVRQPQCEVWSRSAPGCATGDYEEASQICEEAGGRLCTKQEVQDGCTLQTGCNFDNFLLWSSSTAFLV